MLIALSLLLALLSREPSFPHLRPVDRVCAAAFQHGVDRSSTFRGLVDVIQRSDIIVHVQCQQRLRSGVLGQTWLAVHAGQYRYVRVSISEDIAGDEAVAVLGHELYHVTELVRAPHVVDASGMWALYMRVGHKTCSNERPCFDTVEARRAGDLVRDEVRRRRIF